MANEFGFFPDEVYGPDDFTTYFRDFYSNGIKAEDTSYFAVSESIGMTLMVASGIAYIDGHFYRPQDNITVTLAESDTEFPRIDLIEIKCDYVTNKLYVDVVTGEPSRTPTIPQLQRDVAAYCLGLAAVTVAANASEITQADIKDLRFDTDYCGIVVGKIDTISTKRLFAQYEARWKLLEAGCAQDAEAVIAAWSKLGNVKTVNGVEPDESGNIDVITKNIDGIPVDLTGIYNKQMIGYDEEQGKLVPMKAVARTQNIIPSSAVPQAWTITNLVNATDKSSSYDYPFVSAVNVNATHSFKGEMNTSYLLSEFTKLTVTINSGGYGSGTVKRTPTAKVYLSKNRDFSTIDAQFSKKGSTNASNTFTFDITSLKGYYYIKFDIIGTFSDIGNYAAPDMGLSVLKLS